jgi:glycosyltransferase involved in cell wall biosynthesis
LFEFQDEHFSHQQQHRLPGFPRKMNIVQIAPSFVSTEGTGIISRSRAAALRAAGHRVVVVAGWGCAGDPIVGVDVHAVSWSQQNGESRLAESLAQSLATAEVVVLDYTGWHALFDLAGRSAARILVNYHGATPHELIDDPHYRVGWMRCIRQLRELRAVDLLITHSAFTRREFVRMIGRDIERSEVVPAFGYTPGGPRRVTGLAAPRGGFPHPLRLLCVGRLVPHKNYEAAIRALAALRQGGIHGELVHVGEGDSTIAQRYLEKLRLLVEALGVSSQVRFRGKLSREDLERAYADCDAVLLPSLHEGFSLPVVESLHYGKPVFASRAGALPETLAAAGIYFDPLDPDELAGAITSFFRQDPACRTAWGEQAARRAQELSEAKFRETSVRLIESLLPPAATSSGPPLLPAIRLGVGALARGSSPDGRRGVVRLGDSQQTFDPSWRLRVDLLDAYGDVVAHELPVCADAATAKDGGNIAFEVAQVPMLAGGRLRFRLVRGYRGHTFDIAAPVTAPIDAGPGAAEGAPVSASPSAALLALAQVELGWLGIPEPSKRNPFRWLAVWVANRLLRLVYHIYLRAQGEIQTGFNTSVAERLAAVERKIAGDRRG